MRFLKSTSDGLVFHVSWHEKQLLLSMLKLYPHIPAGHHKLSRLSQADPANQALLDEAVAEQRAENRRLIQKFLADPTKWSQTDRGWRLQLPQDEIERLLQVLNDICVGSWIRLGAPESALPPLNQETAPHLWSMEAAGTFQTALLRGLQEQP